MCLHRGIVDTQELIGGGHHVDAVRLALGTFLAHELVDGFAVWSTLEDNAHHKEERPTQSGRSTFGDTAAADIHSTGLIGRSVNTGKGHQSCVVTTKSLFPKSDVAQQI